MSLKTFDDMHLAFVRNMDNLRAFCADADAWAADRDIRELRALLEWLTQVGFTEQPVGASDYSAVAAAVDAAYEEALAVAASEAERSAQQALSLDDAADDVPSSPDPLYTAVDAVRRIEEVRLRVALPEDATGIDEWSMSTSRRELIRRGALNTLISYFESLVFDLVEAFYGRHPEALPDGDSISLAELLTLETVEQAVESLVAREARNVVRLGTDKQLAYLEKRPHVDVSPLKQYKDRLLEISLRRNIIVHNDGVVNETYLKSVPASQLTAGIADGKPVSLDLEYMNEAFTTVYACGLLLILQCWRQWEPREVPRAIDYVVESGMSNALLSEDYMLARGLGDYLLAVVDQNPSAGPLTLDFTLAYATALKGLGEDEGMESVLGRINWTECPVEYRITVHALRSESDEVLALLPGAVKEGAITWESFEAQPLRSYRDEPLVLALMRPTAARIYR